jgi:uncharacterized OB-fold protein
MGAHVTRKLEHLVVESPTRNDEVSDKWAAFREIELIDFPLTFSFRHSLGKVSRFFLELEKQRLMGTYCSACDGGVWLPPRVICPDDHNIMEWVELPNQGILEAFSMSAYTLGTDGGAEHLVLGYIRLAGARTAILQQLKNVSSEEELAHGMSVKVVWADGEVEHPMELFWFELDV